MGRFNILGLWALFQGDNDVPIKRVWCPIDVKAPDGPNRWSEVEPVQNEAIHNDS